MHWIGLLKIAHPSTRLRMPMNLVPVFLTSYLQHWACRSADWYALHWFTENCLSFDSLRMAMNLAPVFFTSYLLHWACRSALDMYCFGLLNIAHPSTGSGWHHSHQSNLVYYLPHWACRSVGLYALHWFTENCSSFDRIMAINLASVFFTSCLQHWACRRAV